MSANPQDRSAPEAHRKATFTSPVSLLLILQLFTGMVVAPVATFFPVYLKDVGYSVILISAIVTLQRIVGLVSSLAGGMLCDSLGSKQTLVLGQIGYFTGTLLFLAQRPGSVSLIWTVCGFGMSLNTLGSQSYLLENANHASLGILTALFYWGYTLGGTVSNPVAGALLGYVGYRGLTLFMAVPAAATLLTTLAVLPRSRRDRPDTPRPSHRMLTGLLGYRDIAAQPAVLMLSGLRFLPTFCYGMAIVFVPLQLKSAGASNGTIALYATVSSVCAALAQLTAGRISDRISWKAPTVAAYLILAATTFIIGCKPDSLWTVFVCATLGIAAAWSLSTLLPTLVAKAVDPSQRGRVLGYVHLFWNLAMILSSVTGGFLFEAWQGLPFLAGGAACACAIGIAAAFFRRVQGDSRPSKN